MLHPDTIKHAASVGFPLEPYQIEDADTLATQGTHFLFLDTGLGKTIVALAAVQELLQRGDHKTIPVVVICPKVAVDMWAATFQQFFPGSSVDIARTGKHFYDQAADCYILPESLITSKQLWGQLWALAQHTLIVDESHYFKTPGAARTKALFGKALDRVDSYVEHPKRIWLLSGTPMPNGLPGELYPALHALSPARIPDGRAYMDFWKFRRSFHQLRRVRRGRHMIWEDIGAKNIEVFGRLLSLDPAIATRRRVSDYLDLDAPRISIYPVAGTQVVLPVELRERIPENWEPRSIEELQELFAVDELMRMVRLFGEAKAPAICDLANMRLQGGVARILVGYWHRNVGDMLQDGLKCAGWEAGRIDGSTSGPNRTQLIEEFEAGKFPVLLGQIRAMGVAINLQACHHIIMAEAHWTPGTNKQLIARCHRMGQKNRVIVDWTVLRGSPDDAIQGAILRKSADEDAAFEEMVA